MDSAANFDVVLLDEDPGWTASIRVALERVGRRVVEATDPQEALDLLEGSRASLVVVGPRAATALEPLAGARHRSHAFQLIVVAADADARTAAAAFAAGATAVISDTVAGGDLVSALAVAERPKPDRFGLSDREVGILELLVRGSSNAEIARALWVTEPTVKFHLSRIYKKLGVSSRTEAAWVARTNGLVSDSLAS